MYKYIMFAAIISFIVTIVLIIAGLIIHTECADVNTVGVDANTVGADDGISTSPAIIGGVELDEIQQKIARQYSYLKLPRHKMSFDEFCYPKKFQLQNPQRFIGEILAPKSPIKEVLGFQRIGAGKSCAAITAANKWTGEGRPLIVMPASLIPGFRAELRGPCSNILTDADRAELARLDPTSARYREIIAAANTKIDSRYDIISYNKFVKTHSRFTPPIFIVDEVHNILSGSTYGIYAKFIQDRPSMRTLVLTATPIFDNARRELVSILRLLRRDVSPEDLDDPEILRTKLTGLVSYYQGAPEHVFPRTTIHYDICHMSKFQTRWFRDEMEAELSRTGNIKLHEIQNNFYARSRARSNIVYPKGLSGTEGAPLLTQAQLLDIGTYSCKLARLMRRLRKGHLSFVYTNFTSYGGIKPIVKCLRAAGYFDYRHDGPGRKYAIFSGMETPREKDAIREIFNSRENDDGSRIQVLIGSPSAKEGISLLRVRQAHVLEPHWNHSKLMQIYGRVSRFCSHKSLPRDEREVIIYLYIAVTADSRLTKNNYHSRDIDPRESVDGYILKLADKKKEINDYYVQLLIDAAIDRALNQ